jgi:hypothetical protein
MAGWLEIVKSPLSRAVGGAFGDKRSIDQGSVTKALLGRAGQLATMSQCSQADGEVGEGLNE